ncbi:MAG: polyphosphate:AMP phosphotransferase [Methylococcaceae bacterium]|nr:MAG: polyphosphate:AMP phosphotransferase [Methylococcaceae bacterium]
MFESAELGHKIDKATYDQEVPALREALLRAQYELIEKARFPVLILVGGVDGAGKSETVNLLNEWMDPRHIQTHGMGEPTQEELQRPYMWRFWRVLPPKGKIGILFGSWYTQPIVNRVLGSSKAVELDQHMEAVVRFEKMLADEGALILKFWMHLSKPQQLKRLTALEKHQATRWRVTEEDWRRFKMYDKFRKASERALRRTSTAEAPWLVVEGNDPRYRSLTVGKSLLQALRAFLDNKTPPRHPLAPPLAPAIDSLHLLKTLDLSLALPKKTYEKELEKYQGRLNMLTREAGFKNVSVMAVFEGNDAAGKGGAIRRVTGALDARRYQIIPIAAPTEEERAQPYLWRFWRHVPAHGRFVIFDRSWYGRVLVERVEGYCSEYDWMRAYAEIVDFEEQLAHNGAVLAKFWLSISKEEQLKRFQEREQIAFKQFKLTEEDWRNREKWEAYEAAVCDMVERTSTRYAPWSLVEANDKYYARVKILKTLCEQIERAL